MARFFEKKRFLFLKQHWGNLNLGDFIPDKEVINNFENYTLSKKAIKNENSKHEIRNSKQIRNSNIKCPKQRPGLQYP
jgi:hypothetical protein